MARRDMTFKTTDASDAPAATAIVKAEATSAGAISTVTRSEGELKAAIYLARTNPRDEEIAFAKAMKSCERPSFAEGALYHFQRAGTDIEGPSVDLARELARVWGNVRYGIRVIDQDEETIHIAGVAYDLETNALVEVEDRFARAIQRRDGWRKPDERELRELVMRRGAICERNAILKLLPPWLKEDAMRLCKETMVRAAKGELRQSRDEAIRRLVAGFDRFGVTKDMLEKRLTHPLQTVDETEMADLRKVWNTLKDGGARVDEYFDAPEKKQQERGDRERASIDPTAIVSPGTPPADPKASKASSPQPGNAYGI